MRMDSSHGENQISDLLHVCFIGGIVVLPIAIPIVNNQPWPPVFALTMFYLASFSSSSKVKSFKVLPSCKPTTKLSEAWGHWAQSSLE